MDSDRRPAESHRVTRAAGVTGAWTLASRILGMVRDQVVAYLFGASMAADAFYVAFRLPNLLRRLSAEGAMSAAFVPVYAQVLQEQGAPAARRTASTVLSLLGLVLLAVTALGVIFAPAMIRVMAPGFADEPEKFALTVTLARVIFPYVLFISLATLLMSQLNTHGHFALPAAAPATLNVCVIAAAFLLGPLFAGPAMGLAVGVTLGGAAQLFMQMPALARRGVLPRPVRPRLDDPLRRMIRRMGPVLLGGAAYQINQFVGTMLASLLPTGAVSWLYYADRLAQFPLGVFGLAMSTAILPSLSRQAAQKDARAFAATAGHGFRLNFFIAMPAAAGLAVLAGPITSLIYQHGRFSAADAQATALALAAYAVGLPLVSMTTVLVRVFNALDDTRTPAVVGAVAVAANLILSGLLMWPLGHAGLALASSLAAGLNLFLLQRRLGRFGDYVAGANFHRGTLGTLAASAGMGLAVWLVCLADFAPLSGAGRAIQTAAGVVVGVAVYLILARLLGSEELRELRSAFSRRNRTARP